MIDDIPSLFDNIKAKSVDIHHIEKKIAGGSSGRSKGLDLYKEIRKKQGPHSITMALGLNGAANQVRAVNRRNYKGQDAGHGI